jgi:hypothetical protein
LRYIEKAPLKVKPARLRHVLPLVIEKCLRLERYKVGRDFASVDLFERLEHLRQETCLNIPSLVQLAQKNARLVKVGRPSFGGAEDSARVA